MSEHEANLALVPKPAAPWIQPSKLDRRIFAKPSIWQRIKRIFGL